MSRPAAPAGPRLDAYRHCANCKRLHLPSNSWHRYCGRVKCQRVRRKLAARRLRTPAYREAQRNAGRLRYATDPAYREHKKAQAAARYERIKALR